MSTRLSRSGASWSRRAHRTPVLRRTRRPGARRRRWTRRPRHWSHRAAARPLLPASQRCFVKRQQLSAMKHDAAADHDGIDRGGVLAEHHLHHRRTQRDEVRAFQPQEDDIRLEARGETADRSQIPTPLPILRSPWRRPQRPKSTRPPQSRRCARDRMRAASPRTCFVRPTYCWRRCLYQRRCPRSASRAPARHRSRAGDCWKDYARR